ncbi:hypothetical protein D3C72_1544790 [compost metagenome]
MPRISRQRKTSNSPSRQRVRADQPQEGGAQRLRRRHDATKHILKLAALLKQNSHRLLPPLEGDSYVGQLGRDAPHGGRRLRSGVPILVEGAASRPHRNLLLAQSRNKRGCAAAHAKLSGLQLQQL